MSDFDNILPVSVWPHKTEYDPLNEQTYTTIVVMTIRHTHYYHMYAPTAIEEGRRICDVENGGNFVASLEEIPPGVECRAHPAIFELPLIPVDFIHPDTGQLIYRVCIPADVLIYVRGSEAPDAFEFGQPGFDFFSNDARQNLRPNRFN